MRSNIAVSDITDDNETVRGACTSHQGLARIDGDDRRHVGMTVVMALTDRRILFVADEGGDGNGGTDAGSLEYGDLAAVELKGDGILVFSETDGVRWEFPLSGADPDAVDTVTRDLQWVGELRSRVAACRNEVDLAVGEMHDHGSAMEWAAAERVYASVRERLDSLIVAVQRTEPIPDGVLAPELTAIERTLERGFARLQVDRAESELDLARQLAGGGEYDRTWTVLSDARRYYDRARARAEEIERGDAFRFGEQRELRTALDRLAWDMEAVAAEPVRQAHEARVQAEEADTPAEAVDHWETAFRRYRDLLDREWEDSQFRFCGDGPRLQSGLEAVAGSLVASRCERARDHWERGVEREKAGDVEAALDECRAAKRHLDRAAEVATEHVPADREDIERRRAHVSRALRRIRDEPSAPSEDADAPKTAGPDSPGGLTGIDTHRKITLETTVEDDTQDGRASGRPESHDGNRYRDRGADADGNGESPPDRGEGEDASDTALVEETTSELREAIRQSDPEK